MKAFIVSITLVLCSVSANPTPQLFGYQPATPAGQWISSNLQNSLLSVSNAIQSLTRPSQGPIGSNQIPNGPDNYGHVQTVVQPVPVQTISVQPYPYPYQPAPYQPGTYQPGPYQPGPYEQQIHVYPVPPPNTPWPNNVPYRNNQNEEPKPQSTWYPLPLYSQFGEPTIVIISRPPSRPTTQQNETTTTNENPTNSPNMHTDVASSTTPKIPTTNSSQSEQTFTPTTGTIY